MLITWCWSDKAELRPRFEQVISSLSAIMSGTEGMITSAAAVAEIKPEPGPLHLAPGAPWRRVEIKPKQIVLGEVLGEGAFAK